MDEVRLGSDTGMLCLRSLLSIPDRVCLDLVVAVLTSSCDALEFVRTIVLPMKVEDTWGRWRTYRHAAALSKGILSSDDLRHRMFVYMRLA